jgi:hypothetical protein
MEPAMINSKISMSAAVIPLVLAFVLPMTAPTASFAQNPPGNKAANGPAVHAGWARPSGYNGTAAPRASGTSYVRAGAAGPGGGNWRGAQGWRGNESWRGDRDHDHRDQNRGFVSGLVTGVVIGGALASQSYGYYGGPGYYEDQYYDPAATPPAPVGDDAVAYCTQNFSSYDPASGTYLGNDGLRHACP